MSDKVLDASALLAMMNGEPGGEHVAGLLDDAAISAVNVAEVATRLIDGGMPAHAARDAIESLRLVIHGFDNTDSMRVAELRPATRAAGLSLGDRACLALAERLGASAVTADRIWAKVKHGVSFELIR